MGAAPHGCGIVTPTPTIRWKSGLTTTAASKPDCHRRRCPDDCGLCNSTNHGSQQRGLTNRCNLTARYAPTPTPRVSLRTGFDTVRKMLGAAASAPSRGASYSFSGGGPPSTASSIRLAKEMGSRTSTNGLKFTDASCRAEGNAYIPPIRRRLRHVYRTRAASRWDKKLRCIENVKAGLKIVFVPTIVRPERPRDRGHRHAWRGTSTAPAESASSRWPSPGASPNMSSRRALRSRCVCMRSAADGHRPTPRTGFALLRHAVLQAAAPARRDNNAKLPSALLAGNICSIVRIGRRSP